MDLEDFMDDIGLKYGGIVLDAKKLESTFMNFGYQVLHLKNLRAQQMEQMLSPENLAKESTGGSSLSEFSSLVVCILGHGEKGAVLGADGAPVLLKRLQYTFNGGSCPDLRGKPKVFIILACQGDNEQLIDNENLNLSFCRARIWFLVYQLPLRCTTVRIQRCRTSKR